MPDRAMMNAQDAVSAHRAECFVTIDGTRHSMLMAKNFEGKAPGFGAFGNNALNGGKKKLVIPFLFRYFPGSCLSSCRKPGKWLVGEAFVLCHDHLQKSRPGAALEIISCCLPVFRSRVERLFPDCPQGLVRPLADPLARQVNWFRWRDWPAHYCLPVLPALREHPRS